MSRSVLWLFIIIAVVAALVIMTRPAGRLHESRDMNQADNEIAASAAPPQAAVKPAPAPMPQPAARPGDARAQSSGGGNTASGNALSELDENALRQQLKITPPNREEVRREVAADPHLTPLALQRFAIDMGRKKELALKSPAGAHAYFSELETCVLDSDQLSVTSAQALCLSDATEVTEKYPELKDSLSLLTSRADPKVVSIAKLLVPRPTQ